MDYLSSYHHRISIRPTFIRLIKHYFIIIVIYHWLAGFYHFLKLNPIIYYRETLMSMTLKNLIKCGWNGMKLCSFQGHDMEMI